MNGGRWWWGTGTYSCTSRVDKCLARIFVYSQHTGVSLLFDDHRYFCPFLSFTYANTFHEGSMQLIPVFQLWVVSLIALCHVNRGKNKCICYFVYLFAETGCELAMKYRYNVDKC